MRKDMSKVITDCYRLGGKYGYKNRRSELKNELNQAIVKEEWDNLETHESIRFWAKKDWNEKEFGEHLGPLKKFLFSKVGQNWDDVYSEICEHIKLNSAQQIHILQHLDQYVEKNTYLGDDNKVYYYSEYPYFYKNNKKNPIEDSFSIVYVSPCDKILRKTPVKKYDFKRKSYVFYQTDNIYVQCHKIWGNWYFVYLKDIPQKEYKFWNKKDISKIKKAEEKINSQNLYYFQIPNGNFLVSYKKDNKGRWIYPKYKDVATADICTSNKIYNRFNKFNPYKINNVYAYKRKQMNSKEIKIWINKENKIVIKY